MSSSTSATITTYFQQILFRDPTSSELNSWTSTVSGGTVTLADVRTSLITSTEASNYVDPVIRLYQAAFGRVPESSDAINYYADKLRDGTWTITNIANNFSASLEFAGRYGSGGPSAAYVTALYVNVLGRTPSASEVDWYLASGMTTSQMLQGFSQSPEFQTRSGSAVDALLDANAQGTAVFTGALQIETAGQTFILTANTDTRTGSSSDDTFDGSTTSNSWSTFDKLDGGLGNDTLNVATSNTATPTGATVVNIENINISTTGAGYTIDATNYTGLKALSVLAATAGAVSVTAPTTVAATATATGNGTVDVIGTGGSLVVAASTGNVTIGGTAVANALTDVNVSGGSAIAITDRSGTSAATGSTLKTVTISKAADDISITANGLTTLNLSGMVGATTVGDTTITAAAGTRALTVSLNGMDTGNDGAATAGGFTVTDAEATSLAVTSATKASYDMTFAVAKATAVTVDAAIATQLDGITAGVATTLGLSGSANITLSAQTLAANAVITSTGTGNRTLSSALAAGQQYVGSSGVDTITLAGSSAVTKAITTGDGNDVITSDGTVGTGGSVDAGNGIDTIVMTSAQAEAADNNSTFNSKFKNFEILRVSDALSATAALNVAGINNVSTVVLDAGGGHATTASVDNLASGGTIQLNANTTGVTANVRDALFNAADSVNLVLNKTGGVLAAGTFTAPGSEIVNITANDASTATGGSAANVNTLTLVATSATTVNVSGNNGLNLTNTGNTKITNFDASGVVANGTAGLDTSANLSVTFVSANNTAADSVKITGGAGADRLAGNAANSDTIVGGAGGDLIVGDAQAEVQTIAMSAATGGTASAITIVIDGVTVTTASVANNATAAAAGTAVYTALNANATLLALGYTFSDDTNGTVTVNAPAAQGNIAKATVNVGTLTMVAAAVTVTTEGAVNAKADVLTGGAGNDSFHFGAGATNLIGNMDTITDLDLGTASGSADILVFGNANGTKSVVTLNSTQQGVITASSTLAAAIDNALSYVTSDGATALFTYGGDTYLVHNGDGNTTFNATADFVIKVTGVTGTLDVSDFTLV